MQENICEYTGTVKENILLYTWNLGVRTRLQQEGNLFLQLADHTMELDEVSIVIWHALETPVSVDSIVSLVRREYLISPEEASEDVNNIVSTLNEMNMILATEGN